MKKYVFKKPLRVKAIQWTGDNTDEIVTFGAADNIYQVIDKPDITTQEPELWLTSSNNEDTVRISNYVIIDNDNEFAVMSKDAFEQNFKTYRGGRGKFESQIRPIYTGIQWTGDNTDECLQFTNGNGSLDASGETIIITTMAGGSVCNKGWYIFEQSGYFFVLDEEGVLKMFKEVEDEIN